MTIERTDNEVIIRLPADMNTDGLQDFINLLSFKEVTSTSSATQSEVDALVDEVKNGRWEKSSNRYIK